MIQTITNVKAKPFLKWAGGKSQLLTTINYYLPLNFRDIDEVTYIEPFVGGGTMLFFMLQTYPNIRKAIINDINSHLINTYKVIRDTPYQLVDFLSGLQSSYRAISDYEAQKDFYLNIRSRFNTEELSLIEEAA